LATLAGDVELRIPKLRKGSFFPSILEPRRRIDQAFFTPNQYQVWLADILCRSLLA
jgi:transposase-like protein